MYQFICIILFSLISIGYSAPEHVRTINFNITEVLDEDRLDCTSQDVLEKLADGEQIQLVANIPYDTETYMWCHDDKQHILMAHCNHTGHQCTHRFQFSAQHGTWNCVYLIDTNDTKDPIQYYQGKKYTQVKCKLNLTAEDNTNHDSDITVENGKKLACSSAQGEFIYGNRLQIIANTPYNVEYMWCDTETQNILAVPCINSGKQCSSLVSLDYLLEPWQGKWQCNYIMDTNGLVAPNAYINGLKKYSQATCEIEFKAVEHRNITMDIKLINNGSRVECTSRNKQEKLMEGDGVYIFANVPYHVKSMSCVNERDDYIAARCIQNGNQCYSVFSFNKSLKGKWVCSYMLRTKGAVEPVEINKVGTKVTRATCELDLEVIDNRDITLDIKVVDNARGLVESNP